MVKTYPQVTEQIGVTQGAHMPSLQFHCSIKEQSFCDERNEINEQR